MRHGLLGRALWGIHKLAGSLAAEKYLRPGHRPHLPESVLAEFRKLLRPGDVILTRKEHALTNYFLPGYFKHAALYLGDAAALAGLAGSMAILADSSPLFAGGRFHRSGAEDATSENHARTGQNVLYLDMHVAWRKVPSAGVLGNHIYLAEGIYEYSGEEAPTSSTDTFLLPSYVPVQ